MSLGGLNSGSSGCGSLANELAQEVSQLWLQETKYIYSQVMDRGGIRCPMRPYEHEHDTRVFKREAKDKSKGQVYTALLLQFLHEMKRGRSDDLGPVGLSSFIRL